VDTFNVQCSMFNVQCSMFNVQCSMFNTGHVTGLLINVGTYAPSPNVHMLNISAHSSAVFASVCPCLKSEGVMTDSCACIFGAYVDFFFRLTRFLNCYII
jgi:hypothetical protein